MTICDYPMLASWLSELYMLEMERKQQLKRMPNERGLPTTKPSIPPWGLGLLRRCCSRPSLPGFGLRRLTAARFRGSGWRWPLAAAPRIWAAALIVATARAGSFIATSGPTPKSAPAAILSPICRRCGVGPARAVGEEKRNAL